MDNNAFIQKSTAIKYLYVNSIQLQSLCFKAFPQLCATQWDAPDYHEESFPLKLA